MDNRLLHAVCVLVFVDHDEFKFFAVSGGDFGRGVENLQREMFHVVEVDNASFAFGFGKFFCKDFRHADKLFNRLVKFAQVGKHFVFVGEEIFFAQSKKFILVTVMQRFYLVFDNQSVVDKFSSAEIVKAYRPNFIVKRVPIVKRSFQAVELFKIAANNFDFDIIFFGEVVSLRAGVENFLQRVENVRLEKFEPSNIFETGVFGQVVRLRQRIKPSFGIRHAQREFVQVKNHFVQSFVAVNASAKFVGKFFERVA